MKVYVVEDVTDFNYTNIGRSYFTNRKQAENFCEYCNLLYENKIFMIAELVCGDYTDYRSMCDEIYDKEYK